ncbi:hypothetical protein MMC11_004562 [Xylographa trunciseda]|nr:hypothetical protein [Xylographa trunciseda]
MAPHNDIVLFHYSYSPYARRVTWYLALRGIEYAQCLQPPTLPREDLNALGLRYRRIPVMSIGRDIYCDTRLILEKLEARFPDGALGATEPDQRAVEKLLEKWCIDGGVFNRASQLIPPETPLLNDPKFKKDREDLSGRSWDKKNITDMRPEAISHIRDAFVFLETGFLADNREWILKTEKPSLADIEAIWPFHWLTGLKGALPPSFISSKQFPKVFAWIDRFNKAIATAKASAPKPKTLKGADAVSFVIHAEFSEPDGQVVEDPLGLEKGQDVEVWPIDSGFKNHDRGVLSALSSREVVIVSPTKVDEKEVKIHHPRTNFRIRQVGGNTKSKL